MKLKGNPVMNKTEHKTDKREKWIHNKWRPMMAWMYFAVCVFDFILFPIFWSILQAAQNGRVADQWDPITLQGAGLFHLAMGAILGVAAWSRGREKIAFGYDNNRESFGYPQSSRAREVIPDTDEQGPLRGDPEERRLPRDAGR